jgi:hypothetical protein
MIKSIPAALSLLMVSVAALEAGTAGAQATQAPAGPGVASLQGAVIKAIGAQDKTVEILLSGPLITVLRVNSNLNGSTHGGRNNEATAIAHVASDAISKTADFADVTTIRVQYIKRSSESDVTIIDTVEFRKNAKGIFEIHVT